MLELLAEVSHEHTGRAPCTFKHPDGAHQIGDCAHNKGDGHPQVVHKTSTGGAQKRMNPPRANRMCLLLAA